MKVRLVVPFMTVALAIGLATPSPAAADTTVFKARFVCNDRGAITPIVGVPVEFYRVDKNLSPSTQQFKSGNYVDVDRLATTRTDGDGRVSVTVSGPEYEFYFRILLDSEEFRALRPYVGYNDPGGTWFADTDTNQNDVGVHDYGNQYLGDGKTSPECAPFQGLRRAYSDYVDTVGGPALPTALSLFVDEPYVSGPEAWDFGAFWPPAYPPSQVPGTFTRSFREFGKLLYLRIAQPCRYDLYDMGSCENLITGDPDQPCRRFADQRNTNGSVTRSYTRAFLEGWGEYWAGAWSPAPNCSGIRGDDFRVPGNVAAAIAGFDRYCPRSRQQMVKVFTRRPSVLSFYAFRNGLGCGRVQDVGTDLVGSRDRPYLPGVSLGLRYAFAKRQLGDLKRQKAVLQALLRKAVGKAKRVPCPPIPCNRSLALAVQPSLIRAKLGEVELLRKTIAPLASRKQLRRLSSRSKTPTLRALDRQGRTFRKHAAAIGALQLRSALNIAGRFLKKDKSAATKAIIARLVGLRRAFRGGRLPAGFLIAPLAGARLYQGPASTPPPPPPPPPPPGAKPDLVVDAVYGTTCNGAENPQCKMYAIVHNIGAADAPASKTAIAGNASFQNETLVDTPALVAGQSTTVMAQCTPYGAGDFSARADATGVVDESDESNNSRVNTYDASDLRCAFP